VGERGARVGTGVLVAAMAVGGVALSAGAASAADGAVCVVGATSGVAQGDWCVDPNGVKLGSLSAATPAPPGSSMTGSAAGAATSSATGDGSGPAGAGSGAAGATAGAAASTTTGTAAGTAAGTGLPAAGGVPASGASGPAAGPAPVFVVVPPPAAAVLAAPPPAVAPGLPAPGLAAPVRLPVAAPLPPVAPLIAAPRVSTAGLAGLAGDGLLSPPLGGTAFDPTRLLTGPAAAPLGTLLDANPALAATTASQVQAMALQGPSNSVRTPVILAVLALALVAGLAVRYRVMTRARRRGRAGHDDLPEHSHPTEGGTDDGAYDDGAYDDALAA
jgi:hypothetical protein